MQSPSDKFQMQMYTHNHLLDYKDNDSSSMTTSCPSCAAAAAMKQLQDFTHFSKLHPAFLGRWGRSSDPRMYLHIEGDMATLFGDSTRWIERLAPYSFKMHHKSQRGSSIFTLLPSLNQVVEVNYKDGGTHLWVKDASASTAVQ
jgi:hypothetical protein